MSSLRILVLSAAMLLGSVSAANATWVHYPRVAYYSTVAVPVSYTPPVALFHSTYPAYYYAPASYYVAPVTSAYIAPSYYYAPASYFVPAYGPTYYYYPY